MGNSKWEKGVDKAYYEMKKGGKVNNYGSKSNGGSGNGGYKDDSKFWLGVVVAFIVINLLFKFF